jgi:hypothetical protein
VSPKRSAAHRLILRRAQLSSPGSKEYQEVTWRVRVFVRLFVYSLFVHITRVRMIIDSAWHQNFSYDRHGNRGLAE